MCVDKNMGFREDLTQWRVPLSLSPQILSDLYFPSSWENTFSKQQFLWEPEDIDQYQGSKVVLTYGGWKSFHPTRPLYSWTSVLMYCFPAVVPRNMSCHLHQDSLPLKPQLSMLPTPSPARQMRCPICSILRSPWVWKNLTMCPAPLSDQDRNMCKPLGLAWGWQMPDPCF